MVAASGASDRSRQWRSAQTAVYPAHRRAANYNNLIDRINTAATVMAASVVIHWTIGRELPKLIVPGRADAAWEVPVVRSCSANHCRVFRLAKRALMMDVRARVLLWPPYEIRRPVYFCPVISIYLSIFFPRLISAVGDWMSTILAHMVWP